MAVPTGEYGATARVDLSPVFGVVVNVVKLTIEQPPEDILDRRLAELGSELEPVRRAAVADLRYFPEAAEKVVPALIASLDDESRAVRTAALSALMVFPAGAADHADRILAILKDEKMSVSERYLAAIVLARTGPLDEAVGEAIEAASADAPEGYRPAYQTALRTWRGRTEARDAGDAGAGGAAR